MLSSSVISMESKLFLGLFASLNSLLKIGKHTDMKTAIVSCNGDSPFVGSRPPSDARKARLVSFLNRLIGGIFKAVNQSKVFDAIVSCVSVNVVNFFVSRVLAVKQLPNDPVCLDTVNVVEGSEKITTTLRNGSKCWLSCHFGIPIVGAAFGAPVARLKMMNRAMLPC